MIAGWTDYDAQDTALAAILKEWRSSSSYSTRVDHILGKTSGGLNGGFVLTSATGKRSTVHADGDLDELTGSAGSDLFFANLLGGVLDKIKDKQSGEVAIDEV